MANKTVHKLTECTSSSDHLGPRGSLKENLFSLLDKQYCGLVDTRNVAECTLAKSLFGGRQRTGILVVEGHSHFTSKLWALWYGQ